MSFSLYSQTTLKHFTSDSALFFDEMEQFLTKSRRDEGMLIMDDFSWHWGKFSDKGREEVYKMANLMLKKKKKAFPDFKNYLYTISEFISSEHQTEDNFKEWQKILGRLVKGKSKKKFSAYLKSCNSLFSENLLYKSGANSWAADNSNYKFGFDSLPTIEFETLTLTCYSKGDSSVIYNTKGIYYPTEGKWVGQGGKITWERAGFSPDSVYANINKYVISLKSPKYTLKNVLFYNLNYFKEPLKGIVQEKVLANVTASKASYPKFDSYEAIFSIKDIAAGVDYIGGFSLYGRKVVGRGTDTQDAYLIFKRKDIPFLKMASKVFIIKPERIVSQIAAATFYIKNDSIFHPGLSFKFFVKDRTVSMLRDGKGIKITPYTNTYHQVDMDFESLVWKVDSPMIEFKNMQGGTNTKASFFSAAYFKLTDYRSIMGMQESHPLYTIKEVVDKLDTNFLTNRDVAVYTLQSNANIETMLLELSYLGFINYNYDAKTFVVKDKLLNWVKASGGKVDYDVIGFFSSIKGKSNATLSLLNYDLKIRGINSVNVSDSQEVLIYPARKEIVLKKNRDFDFSGVIQAGRFDIIGSNFSFKYNEFKIDMPIVDSLRIYAETGRNNRNGEPVIKPVETLVNNIKGDLLIDKPNNKSGIKLADEYPKINSYEDSYVYYDKKSIQKGVYEKEHFYFHLDPFSIDSLDNFDNDQLRFKGEMMSAGIFPDFKESLTLQPDHSLGFIRETPSGGFPMYGGKGTYHDTIRLSNEGLRGNGKLKYIASTTYSNDFIFAPDSMNAIAQNFKIEKSPIKVQFPPVEGKNVETRWLPKKDIMYHKEIDQPIAMYDMQSFMSGKTMIQPDGLSGTGTFEFQKAELSSNLMRFRFSDFSADTADFNLKSGKLGGEESTYDFKTVNVNTYITFEERYGEFKSNGGGSFVSFDPVEYICYMEEFKWYMDNDNLELSAGETSSTDASGVKLDGAQFISTKEGQDSLSFFSTKAKYDLKHKRIYADGVKFINVADAMVYPDSGRVVLDKGADMNTLYNSKVIANYITKNHNIYNATINIFGQRKYSGRGYIDYIDELEKTQAIYLEKIAVDITGQTFAIAEIKDTANFTLSSNYEFYGGVKLFSSNKNLTFNGYSRIVHDCDLLAKNFFSFEQEIDPKEIYLPIDSATKDVSGKPLTTSMFLSPDSIGIYTSFLNKKKQSNSIAMISANGYLFYDKVKQEYQISNKDKLIERSFSGSYLSLNTKNCKIYGEGKIDLGNNTGQLKMDIAGVIEHNQLNDEAIFDLVMLTDFFFNEEALKKMTKHLEEASELDPANLDRPTFGKGLKELVGLEEGDKLIGQISLNGQFKKVPKSLSKTFMFNDVKMRWDNESKSFKSFGDIGLSNIKDKQINKYVKGHIEFVKKRSGDVLTIYLEIDKNNWYFFSYTRGMMQAISSNVDFNTAITETKPDKRKLKSVKGQDAYHYMYSTKRKKRDFLREFEE
tara:strand:- start:2530 stop:6936 length:4407 start_codon:yes stop_codon:yes gene_type:complete